MPIASDKIVVDTVNDYGAELSNDSDKHHNKEINLVEKNELMNSYCF